MPDTSDLVARLLGATDAELGLGTSPRFRVYVRNGQYERVEELDNWVSFTCIARFNGVGTWALEMSADSPQAALFTPMSGIIVIREVNGVETTVFSGSVSSELAWTARTFRAAGRSDEALLEESICRPTPSQSFAPFPDEYHVVTHEAAVVMAEFVQSNIGASAPAFWQNPYLILGGSGPTGTPTVTGRGRFQPILTVLQELSSATGLGFKLVQSDAQPGAVEFNTFEPTDRSTDARFAIEQQTAQDYEAVWRAPDVNYAYVLLGDGLGNARTVLEGGDAASIAELGGRRIARVIDIRDVTDTSEGEQRLAEALAGAVSLKRSSIVPFDVPSLTYGEHWDLGDLVTIVTPFGETVDLIREVEISNEPETGWVVTPIVGKGDGSDEERIGRYIGAVQDRLGNIERNWTVPDSSVARAMLVPVMRPYIGEVKWLAGSTVPAGALLCNGQAVSRTTYSLLFAEIGTTWGVGNGSTTFNVPNLLDRSPIGAGATYSVGQAVGASSATLGTHSHSGAPHTHPGSHSHGAGTLAISHVHAGAVHTHPGSHSHGLVAHRHQMGHDHTVNIGHNHGGVTSGPSSTTARSTTVPTLDVATDFHWHDIASHSGSPTTSNANNTVTGDGEKTSGGGAFNLTDVDSTAHAASAANTGLPVSVLNSGSTDSDSNAPAASFSAATGAAGGGSVSIVHPSAGLLPVIYAGV